MIKNRSCLPLLHDVSILQNNNPVCHLLENRKIVRHQHHPRLLFLLQRLKLPQHLCLRNHIECTRRLIRQKKRRMQQHRERNPDALVPYVLISNGANPNRLHPKTGWTALFYAVHYNSNPDVVRALVIGGALLNVRDIFGKTAADYLWLNPKLRDTETADILNPDYYPSDSSASR